MRPSLFFEGTNELPLTFTTLHHVYCRRPTNVFGVFPLPLKVCKECLVRLSKFFAAFLVSKWKEEMHDVRLCQVLSP